MDITKKFKEDTSVMHTNAEAHPLNQRLMSGVIDLQEYTILLESQCAIFEAIESNPECNELLTQVDMSGRILTELDRTSNDVVITDDVVKYAHYLRNVRHEALVPHIYLNYLQLLYGGQLIKKLAPTSGSMFDIPNARDIIDFIRREQVIGLESDYTLWTIEVEFGYLYWECIYDSILKLDE